MKYNLAAFNNAVKYYEKALKNYKKKTILVLAHVNNDAAFYSIAPLSRAIHNLNSDMHVMFHNHDSNMFNIMKDVWDTYADMKKGVKNQKTMALKDFISIVDKKAKGEFEKIFPGPDLILNAGKNVFTAPKLIINFRHEWFKKHNWSKLLQTAKKIWKQVYDLKKNEKVGFSFELILREKDMELPLEDYLDSYAITRAMFSTINNTYKVMTAATGRESQLEKGERIGELKATIIGCELSKDINEPVFKKYKRLSKLLKLNRIKFTDAVFGIHGKGYAGKHLFGDLIGYPTPNKKSRWSTPSGILYKFDWYPQTKYDTRDPKTRIAFTETLPIDTFIQTCNIDWLAMQRRNDKIIKVVEKSDKIVVSSRTSNFEVILKGKKGRRHAKGSDVDTRHKYNVDYYKRTGIKAGTMANLPGGEAFMTPEYIKGRFYGDVVISIDQSYLLNAKDPLTIDCDKNGYRIVKGPEKIVNKIKEKKKEAWKRLLEHQKNKSVPKEIINLRKKNFENIGEFAINTHPTAKLSNYLIVNEKIANMIHIALGSGFDADKATDYHYDIVINAKKQKMDICGVKGKHRQYILKKGKFVV
jgi:leucyl aminopeptidase (aminopeptidase T)